MKPHIFALASALLASACTITPQNNGSVDAQLHLPIVEHNWKMQSYTLQTGDKACAISSGYNGLTVLLSHPPGREEGVVVESNRRMEPGTTLTVSVNGNNFQTTDHFFSATTGRALLQEFAKGGKAYFDWAEIEGPPGPAYMHITNIVHLDDFVEDMKQCKGMLAAAAH
jgi:hypothetical protein